MVLTSSGSSLGTKDLFLRGEDVRRSHERGDGTLPHDRGAVRLAAAAGVADVADAEDLKRFTFQERVTDVKAVKGRYIF